MSRAPVADSAVQPPLRVENLSCGVTGKSILSGVSFSMERGELRAVIGLNGAGKSTLVRCVSGVARINGGAVRLFGRDQPSLSRRELAGLVCHVPQTLGNPPAFTVRDFVGMGRYAHAGFWQVLSRRDRERTDAALELAGVARLAGRTLPTLSGGEMRLVAIAAGLAQEAELLLLDEPSAFLDPFHQDLLLDLIRKLNREQGISLLIVTHDVNLAMLFTHRTLALREGKVVYDGPSAGLSRGDALERIYGMRFGLLPAEGADRFLAVSEKYSSC
ncbi:MAG: ABC transporter ATP-binding protein [Planctomycetota bacterium]|jgi:iron complex transport system ATP-binding protein|nr:ABC transporter ATP-binding protein [Planctomycetota bacterium]